MSSTARTFENVVGPTVYPWDGLPRLHCWIHARYLDATGLCPTCQREAKEQAETRANNEAVRRIAVEAEAAVMAEMYQL